MATHCHATAARQQGWIKPLTAITLAVGATLWSWTGTDCDDCESGAGRPLSTAANGAGGVPLSDALRRSPTERAGAPAATATAADADGEAVAARDRDNGFLAQVVNELQAAVAEREAKAKSKDAAGAAPRSAGLAVAQAPRAAAGASGALADPGASAAEANPAAERPRLPGHRGVDTAAAAGGDGGGDLSEALGMIRDYRRPISLPDCEAEDAVIVSSADQLTPFLVQSKRVICFASGDYRAAGTLQLGALSGSADAPRVLRHRDAPRNEATLDDSEHALLPPLRFEGAAHWIVAGLSWRAADTAISVDGGAALHVERNRFAAVQSALSIRGEIDTLSVQDNWVVAAADHRGSCVALASAGQSTGLRLVGNQLDNCHTGLSLRSQSGSVQLIVADNDLHRDAPGPCGGSGIAVHARAEEATTNTLLGNRLSGWRGGRDCGAGEANAAITIGASSRQLQVEKNLLHGNQRALQIAGGAEQLLLRDNLISDSAGERGERDAALVIAGETRALRIEANHLIDSGRWLDNASPALDLRCNVIIDGGDSTGTSVVDGEVSDNSYFNTYPGVASAADGSDQLFAGKVWAGMERACLDTHRLAGERELCVRDALSTIASPQRCGSSHWRDQSTRGL